MTEKSSHHDATYLMARDASASLRLNYQHWILKDRQGWLLHPVVEESIRNRSSIQVADIGCGNGIWSIELASQLPSAQITAMDISTAQFPPPTVSPDSITWAEHDIGDDDIPTHYLGRFDIVYCRFLIQSAPRLSTEIVIDRVRKMLKPGGWFQWDEMVPPVGGFVDPVSLRPVDGPPHPVYAIPNEIYATWSRIEQVPRLDTVFARHGLVRTELTRPGFNRTYLRAGSDNNVVGAMEWYRTVEPTLPDGELKARLTAATQQMQEEARSGKFFGLFYVVAIGQAPPPL